MKYRIYYNRIEEYYIDLEADSYTEAEEKWENNDLTDEQEVGNGNVEIENVYTEKEMKELHNIII